MSNPDGAAGPYVANEKKPVGGNIIAHASTTRCILITLNLLQSLISAMLQLAAQEGSGCKSPGQDLRLALSPRIRDDVRNSSEWHRRPGRRVRRVIHGSCFSSVLYASDCCCYVTLLYLTLTHGSRSYSMIQMFYSSSPSASYYYNVLPEASLQWLNGDDPVEWTTTTS